MDKKLQLIAHLYGEAEDASTLNELLQDPELNEEYQQLSEAKFWLDHSASQKPAPEIITQVLAAAASHTPASAELPKRPLADDRPAKPRMRVVAPALMRIAASAVVLFGALFVLWPRDEPLIDQMANMKMNESFSADEAPAAPNIDLENREQVEQGLVQADAFDAGLASATSPQAFEAFEEDSIPGWDESEDMHSVRKRIEALMQQYDGQNWDNPVVPLERLPGNATTLSGSSRLQQAGSSRRNP